MEDRENALNTKQQILDSAYAVFMQNGVNGTGIKEIADRAEVNKAMLYYYFDSKEHLFTEVFKKAAKDSGLGSLEMMEDPNTSLFQKIKNYIDALTDRLLEDPMISSFVMNELNRHPELLAEMLSEAIDFDRSVLDRQIKEAADGYEIARIDSRQLLANINSLCLGPVINKKYYSAILEIDDDAAYTDFLQERKGIIYDMVISWLTS